MLINERRDRGSGFRMKTLSVVMTAIILATGGAVEAEPDSLSTLQTRIDQIETTIGDLKRELKTLQTNIKEKDTAETDAKKAEADAKIAVADAKKDLDSVKTRLGLAQELQTLSNGSVARIERVLENVLQKRVEAAEGKLEAAEGKLEAAEWKLEDAKLERDAKRGKPFEAK